MRRNVRTVSVIVAVGLLLGFGAWSIQRQRAHQEREAFYRAALGELERDLKLGTPRAEVKKYLASRKLSYEEPSGEVLIKVGKEPDLVCPPTVYLDLQFNRLPQQAEPSPSDNLRSISITRAPEDCL